MKNKYKTWMGFSFLLIVYKSLLDFMFLPMYYTVFSYMTGATYIFSLEKFSISGVLFVVLIVSSLNIFKHPDIFTVIAVILHCVCIVPMLSVYAFVSYVTVDEIIYPAIFWIILLTFFSLKKNYHGASMRLEIPFLKSASAVILVMSCFGTVICWAWAGFPILLSLADSRSQRIALRANSMPTLLSYVFVALGGVIFPYLFARFLNSKKILYAIIAFVCGFLLFSINGMKTWLFLYLFVIALYVICRIKHDDAKGVGYLIIIALCIVQIFCVEMYLKAEKVDFLSQFGRVFCIPNGIGFRSITFFKDNELLYLRESILRHLFETPYQGGSDFYIEYGAKSTVTSSRSNNGLWGDAFRNFGLVGMFVYPLLIGKSIDIVKHQTDGLSFKFQIFILFLIIWNSVNVSFFTWLLTGGVILVYLLNCFFAKEDEAYKRNQK